jgi:predicted CoA-substrate-specific enzyme activase
MTAAGKILGIDVGSVAVSAVLIDPTKKIIDSAYFFHQGDVRHTLEKIFSSFDNAAPMALGATSSTPSHLSIDRKYDNRIAVIAACRHYFPAIGSILLVGGERFGLLTFDESGNYKNYKTNTSCAAGTGSFLDQQARRLNLAGAAELARIALMNKDEIPRIASRCAVFAKTDLVHAQQEGYSLAAICEGLCRGLAQNIVNTLFTEDNLSLPIIFAGGVAKNSAVVNHISSILKKEIIADSRAHLFGALGAAFLLSDESGRSKKNYNFSSLDLMHPDTDRFHYDNAPLKLTLSHYPAFKNAEHYEFQNPDSPLLWPIEVDVYEHKESGKDLEAYFGIDIGSTSTKALILLKNGTIFAAFYTKTAGKPIDAVQEIMAAIRDLEMSKCINLHFLGAGATGSGRKLIGRIIGADCVIDEISAHARAALHIRPDADTIIEIGGQDSKFTTLANQMVTFCAMNTVCAAGTGSFIEEQAEKLGCPLSEYSARTENERSPVTSDRCTVFMERDLNHYLNLGYSTNQVLASVLHSITENYLTKVAIESSMGECILFQGATAKNRALVAAFEKRLGKPIHVSPYCHVAGALGVALVLRDQNISKTAFRGRDLIGKKIPVKSEICNICTNHCKITVAQIDGRKTAYGFLCGRDYETKRYINNNTSGFDLLKARKNITDISKIYECRSDITIGIPAALYLREDTFFWKTFFKELAIRSVSSEVCETALSNGKRLAGAEFCAPMAAFHGHVDYLLDKSDFVFTPYYMEQKTNTPDIRRNYCYYSQFAPALAQNMSHNRRGRILAPLLYYRYSRLHVKKELYRTFKPLFSHPPSFLEVSKAYDRAIAHKESCLCKMRERYIKETDGKEEFHVVLLGRPYTILDNKMNKGIPDIFASMGIKIFYQDMLSCDGRQTEPIKPLLNEFHWHYAAKILEAAQIIGISRFSYPVLITSFRCSPDSFVIEYFKKIMESAGKPYLMLQLDEHDSSVGYETRIEAAARSFKNHLEKTQKTATAGRRRTVVPAVRKLKGKTLLFPNWDNLSLRLLMVCLRKAGIDARLMEESESIIQKSLRLNTGQCIPLNIIASEFINYIEKYDLDPGNTALWMMDSIIPCNLRLFKSHIKYILESHGHGMEEAQVYTGGLSMSDLSVRIPVNAYFAFMFGGIVRKMGCLIRPYEKLKGTTDKIIEESVHLFSDAFLGKCSKEEAVAETVLRFKSIETENRAIRRPKVAIFGDLYVRDNDVMNQNLIHFIEDHGGEVVTTPYSSYVKMIARPYFRKWLYEGRFLEVFSSGGLISLLTKMETRYTKYFKQIIETPEPAYDTPSRKILSEYNLRIEHTGESMDNILKIFYLLENHPDISLFVQTSPAFCCPSLVTEAMADRIQKKTGVPIVSITYDGTGGNKNESIIPFLTFKRA